MNIEKSKKDQIEKDFLINYNLYEKFVSKVSYKKQERRLNFRFLLNKTEFIQT